MPTSPFTRRVRLDRRYASQAHKKRDQLEEGRKLIPSSTSNGGRKMYWLISSIQQKN